MKNGFDRFDVAVGQEIARLRSGAHRTRYELANALGISYQQVQKYETGRSALTFSKLMQIANFLGVPFLDLLPEEERSVVDPELPASAQAVPISQIRKSDMALAQAIAEIEDEIAKEALVALVARMSSAKAIE